MPLAVEQRAPGFVFTHDRNTFNTFTVMSEDQMADLCAGVRCPTLVVFGETGTKTTWWFSVVRACRAVSVSNRGASGHNFWCFPAQFEYRLKLFTCPLEVITLEGSHNLHQDPGSDVEVQRVVLAFLQRALQKSKL